MIKKDNQVKDRKMNLFPIDIELLRRIDADQNFKISNHSRVDRLMKKGLVRWQEYKNIGWFLTPAGKETLRAYSEPAASKDGNANE